MRAPVRILAAAALAVALAGVAGPAHAGVAPEAGTQVALRPRPAPPAGPVAPVASYRISGRFGDRGHLWRLGHHTGLDFVARYGTPVRAVADGRVVKLAWNAYWGRMVILQVAPGVTVWYCHLSKVLVKVGDVTRGQLLGRIGTSGNSTGAHLHLEVRVKDRPTDPATYLWGAHPGTPGAVPRWYPKVPIMTVADLAPLGSR
ncbi:MAG: M23 family metallopeptidase [Candidatus Nanopelagicales bacterium]